MTTESSVGHYPDGRWVFDDKVAGVFDDMLERSIPLYAMTLDLVCRMALRHLRDGDTVLDLGVSTGNALRRLTELADGKVRLRLIGVDNAAPMLEKARAALPPSAELIEHDLRYDFPYRALQCRPKVVLSLWTAQFIPIEHRSGFYRRVRESIDDGGAFFVAEKLRGQSAAHQRAMVETYHAWKAANGYPAAEIEAKARSLEGVLVPMDAPGQKAMLAAERWSPEEIIRYLGFAAWSCHPV